MDATAADEPSSSRASARARTNSCARRSCSSPKMGPSCRCEWSRAAGAHTRPSMRSTPMATAATTSRCGAARIVPVASSYWSFRRALASRSWQAASTGRRASASSGGSVPPAGEGVQPSDLVPELAHRPGALIDDVRTELVDPHGDRVRLRSDWLEEPALDVVVSDARQDEGRIAVQLAQPCDDLLRRQVVVGAVRSDALHDCELVAERDQADLVGLAADAVVRFM